MAERPIAKVRHKGVIVWLGALATVAAGGGRQWELRREPDIVVKDSYFSPGSGEIKLLGVCDPFAGGLPCWDSDGKVDRNLSQHVAKLLAQKLQSNFGNVSFPLEFIRKNRIVVFQTPGNSSSPRHPFAPFNWSIESVGALQILPGTFDPSSDPKISLYPASLNKADKVTSITVQLNDQSLAPIELPFQAGATTTGGGHTLTLKSVGKSTNLPPQMFIPNTNQVWSATIKLDDDSLASPWTIDVQALDSHGKPIEAYDQDGRPKQLPKSKFGLPDPMMLGGFGQTIYSIRTSQFQSDLSGRVWSCGINPRYISKIRLTLSKSLIVQFKNIPLDPVREGYSR